MEKSHPKRRWEFYNINKIVLKNLLNFGKLGGWWRSRICFTRSQPLYSLSGKSHSFSLHSADDFFKNPKDSQMRKQRSKPTLKSEVPHRMNFAIIISSSAPKDSSIFTIIKKGTRTIESKPKINIIQLEGLFAILPSLKMIVYYILRYIKTFFTKNNTPRISLSMLLMLIIDIGLIGCYILKIP